MKFKTVLDIIEYNPEMMLDTETLCKELVTFSPVCKNDMEYIKELALTHMTVENYRFIISCFLHNLTLANYDDIMYNTDMLYNNKHFVSMIAMFKKIDIQRGTWVTQDLFEAQNIRFYEKIYKWSNEA